MKLEQPSAWTTRTTAWADRAAQLLSDATADDLQVIRARIVAIGESDSGLLHELGLFFAQHRDFDLAAQIIGLAAAASPHEVHLWLNLGRALSDAGHAAEAVTAYDRALALRPEEVAAHFNRAAILATVGQTQAARAGFEHVIALNPQSADAHYNLGILLTKLGQHQTAIESCERALALRPAFAPALCARGDALRAMGDCDRAIADYDRALTADPRFADAAINRGLAFQEVGRIADAIASYDLAIAIAPDAAPAQFAKSTALLLSGDYRAGLPLFERRFEVGAARTISRVSGEPPWLGDATLNGRTILLQAEQGLGDTIQFSRYATVVAATGARVMLEVPAPLTDLMRTLSGVDVLITRGEPLPPFDTHCPLMSLPLAFGTTVETIPAQAGYLHAEPARSTEWAARLGPKQRPRVGVAWSGSLAAVSGAARSIALAEFATLLHADCDFYCLQTDIADADAQTLATLPQLNKVAGDFATTAALCMQLDLVISVDTSIAHLAGALGVPVWILLQASPDWRWLLSRTDTPWYPSARLYRQHRQGDWSGLLADVRLDLTRLLATHA